MATLYLDLDGVLADFDYTAGKILGTDNIYKWEFVHGPKAFWDKLNKVPDLFAQFRLKDDAHILWNAVSHMEPVILTALPKSDDKPVDRQKRDWVAEHLGSHVEVITCETKDKPKFCKPGDILVDDRAVNRAAWIKAGGIYILHERSTISVACLKALGII